MISYEMKFQLSPATGCTGSYMKETGAARPGIADSWKPEAQARGWGTPRIVLTPLLAKLRALCPRILLHPNPSLALQDSMT